mgnify:CR=1 FL=1
MLWGCFWEFSTAWLVLLSGLSGFSVFELGSAFFSLFSSLDWVVSFSDVLLGLFEEVLFASYSACWLFVLFFIFIYVVSIDNIPQTIEIFQGEEINIPTLWGIKISNEDESIETSSTLYSSTFNEIGEEKLEVSLFDKIRLKTINVNVIEDVDVIPVGEIVGIKLYTNGVMVVGMASIEGEDGNIYKPYQDTGIQEGDCITYVNGTEIASTEDLTKEINKSLGNEIELTFNHKEETKTGKIKSVKNKDGKYKLGLWVRDSAAGVGTVTFYNEDTKCFSALGHAITDIDTGEVLTTSSGEIDTARILSIVKGQKDEPGRVEGAINSKTLIGSIYNNTKFGIFGVIKNTENIQLDFNKKMKVASRNEIKLGEATCLSSIDGEIKEYKLEITKIYQNNNYDNKSMLINITDENLLEKTGGIIQGMSGTPIIQNGKFVGAITHVFVP